MQQKNIRRNDGQKSKMSILRKQNSIQVKNNDNKSKSNLNIMADKEEKDNAQESIARLQILEQNMQSILMQKQQFQAQLVEIESALKEMSTTNTVYKIVGNIMVNAEKAELEKDLKQKKEFIDIRIKNLEKQEMQFKDKTKKLQEEVLKTLKKE